MSIESDLQTYIQEAEDFLQSIFTAVEGVFGAGNPMANALTDLAAKLSNDIEAVKLVVDGVEQTLIPTKAVSDQILNFIAYAKNGILGGAMAATWEQELLAVIRLGIPVALAVLAPGSGPLVTLSEDVASKLIALL